MAEPAEPTRVVPIFIVSGGPGATGRLLLDTLLSQFPGCEATVRYFKDIRTVAQLDPVLESARDCRALVIHSLVDSSLRAHMASRAEEFRLETHDVFGQLLQQLERRFDRAPLAQPGRYRQLRQDYYERIEAIEFTIEHDDSQNLHSLDQAEIILVGVSRSGKTPLSMYLGMQGWKTANVSFVPNVPWPDALDRVEKGRIVGLCIDLERLATHRKHRSSEVGLGLGTVYSNEESLFEELEALRAEFRKRRLPVIDVTEKAIETTAHEVIQLVTRAMGDEVRRR